jgi:hypothetical protein
MMERTSLTSRMPFNNILYIGEEAKTCIAIIEEFNNRLAEIEKHYSGWFRRKNVNFSIPDKLQYHIHYHFEGGIAIFKFRNEDEIPPNIREECLLACKNIAAEQLYYVS